MQLSHQQIVDFQETLWAFYDQNGRHDLLWRQPETDGLFDPYKIMVSELMLQQTQVSRVTPKYSEFLTTFPTVTALATAELGDVLRCWQGLGYNRRAKFLWQAVQAIATAGAFPQTKDELVRLPGIGPNTAGAILAYAFNQPAIFIETNVRTVYIHRFLSSQGDIHDREITELVAQTIDREQPRAFYWALMDYGSHLKATIGNVNKASKHYTKQSTFQGSKRQVRGAVLRELVGQPVSLEQLAATISDPRLELVLSELVSEDLISVEGLSYRL